MAYDPCWLAGNLFSVSASGWGDNAVDMGWDRETFLKKTAAERKAAMAIVRRVLTGEFHAC